MRHDHENRTGTTTEAESHDQATITPRLDRTRSLDDGKQPPRKRPPWYRRPLPAALVIAAMLVLTVGGVLFWRHARHYESTDDAYVDVVPQRVNPQVAGLVAHVLVNDNQVVAIGQILVEIDRRDFETRLTEARAQQSQAEAQRADAEAQYHVFEAQREQARAAESVAATQATNTARDLKRAQEIWHAGSGISRQELDHAEAQATSAAAQHQAAQKSVAAAEAELTHASRLIDVARAAVRSAAAQVAQAELTLSYTEVRASVAGRVARKTVAPGDYVQPGTDLMAIVPREVYVTANFKETQLTRMRPGQPARITVDAYPDLELTGHVDSIQSATGQAFDVLPSQNAAGNWVKVVQRVPVKIVFDRLPAEPIRLGDGMSVTATVTVR